MTPNTRCFCSNRGWPLILDHWLKAILPIYCSLICGNKVQLPPWSTFGGNVVTMGPMLQHDDQQWRIGIQDPVQPRHHYKRWCASQINQWSPQASMSAAFASRWPHLSPYIRWENGLSLENGSGQPIDHFHTLAGWRVVDNAAVRSVPGSDHGKIGHVTRY